MLKYLVLPVITIVAALIAVGLLSHVVAYELAEAPVLKGGFEIAGEGVVSHVSRQQIVPIGDRQQLVVAQELLDVTVGYVRARGQVDVVVDGKGDHPASAAVNLIVKFEDQLARGALKLRVQAPHGNIGAYDGHDRGHEQAGNYRADLEGVLPVRARRDHAASKLGLVDRRAGNPLGPGSVRRDAKALGFPYQLLAARERPSRQDRAPGLHARACSERLRQCKSHSSFDFMAAPSRAAPCAGERQL